jgi:hypothetical protein
MNAQYGIIVSPQSVNSNNFDFVPYRIEDRVDVTQLSKEKIEDAVKNSNVFKQEVILQDLLLAGRNMENKEQRNMVVLAAELYVKTPEETRRDFLLHLVGVKAILKNFANAMLANHIYHDSIEGMRPGSSGLSQEELIREKSIALALEKFVK